MNEKCILVVDDDHEIVRAIAILLEKEGYKVLCEYNGLQALEMAMHSIRQSNRKYYFLCR
jgi:CheY-like chemotaxis protein